MTMRIIAFVAGPLVVTALSVVEAQQAPVLYIPGQGISAPILLKQVKANYTPEAQKAKIQGEVLVQAVVLTDGYVRDVSVVRLLDAKFGLHTEAVKAVRLWIFRPAMKDGKPVTVQMTISVPFAIPKTK